MHIELIVIGDELLDGRTRDANFHYLGGKLREYGSTLARVVVIADEPKELIRLFREATLRADLVITSGGLGPTRDDRTRNAVAKASGAELIFHQEISDRIRASFKARGMEMPEINQRQAMIPDKAVIHPNAKGTADGFEVKINDTPLLSLPGVPSEFRHLIDTIVLPRLAEGVARPFKEFHVFGRGESDFALVVEALELPKELKVTWRPSYPTLTIELSVEPGNEEILDDAYQQVMQKVSPWAFESPTQSVSSPLANLLAENDWTLSTAESCTGGLIASKLTDLPGASAWFQRGYVVYSDQAKRTDLGVPQKYLDSFGAVSHEVAEAMAQGARSIADVTVAIAVTGIAGPGGGSDEKPVGRVFISAATKEKTVILEVQISNTSRTGFKKYVSEFSMLIALRLLQGREEELEDFRGVQALHITEDL